MLKHTFHKSPRRCQSRQPFYTMNSPQFDVPEMPWAYHEASRIGFVQNPFCAPPFLVGPLLRCPKSVVCNTPQVEGIAYLSVINRFKDQ